MVTGASAGANADERAISTVMDISLALLLISASVVAVGLYLHEDGEQKPSDGQRADRALETLSGTTITITYDLGAENESGVAATDSEYYDRPSRLESDAGDADRDEIMTYGSATELLGEAALTNVRIDGTELFAYGHDVERSVEAATQGRLAGGERSVYAIATWKPYDGAGIAGTATVGERPPRSADVSSATTTVSSPVPAVDAETLADAFLEGETGTTERSGIEDGFDTVGEEIAGVIVDGYFPPRETQYALESTLPEHAVTVYDYRRTAATVGVDVDDHVTGETPSATAANAALRGDAGDADGLAAAIAADMRTSRAGAEIRETYAAYGDDPTPHERAERRRALESTFDEVVSTEPIEITVQTYE
ncbi:DUF7284 family protein [Halopiger thermotolerans]